MGDIDPREVLREARQCVKSRDYAAALEKYIWFHNHALDANRFLVGVRLSYAVSEWADLGEVYPPALRALEDVRNAKTSSLMNGNDDSSLFHDVKAINRALGQVERTRDLFKIVAESNRGFAEKCFPVALECLVLTKEFNLARSFMPDVRSEVDRLAVPFKSPVRSTPSSSREMKQEIFVKIYVKSIGLLLGVLIGVGDEVEAKRVRQYAIDCITDEELRDMVTEHLAPSPPPSTIQ